MARMQSSPSWRQPASGAFTNVVVILHGRVIDPEAGLDDIRNVATEGDKNRGDMWTNPRRAEATWQI